MYLSKTRLDDNDFLFCVSKNTCMNEVPSIGSVAVLSAMLLAK